MTNIFSLPLCILGTIINDLESEKDLFSFMLTCTVLYNCTKLERSHLRVRFSRHGNQNEKLEELVPFLLKTFGRLRSIKFENCDSSLNLSWYESLTDVSGLRQVSLDLSRCESLTDVSCLSI